MKKIASLILLLCLFVVPIAQAQLNIQITIPSFGQWFLGPKTGIVVTNGTQFFIELIALNKLVARIPPGGTIFDDRRFEFDNTQLPLLARAYLDDGCRQYVGVTGYVLSLSQGNIGSWVIQQGNIRRPDGVSGGTYSAYPSQDVGGSAKAHFPRIDFMSTTAVQFINNTMITAIIRLKWHNGEDEFQLEPNGDFHYSKFENKYSTNFPVLVNAIFSDRGRFIGHYEANFSVGNSPQGVQFIIDPNWIRF